MIRYIINGLPKRLRWFPHNVFAHPLSEILFQLRLTKAAAAVHNGTVPEEE